MPTATRTKPSATTPLAALLHEYLAANHEAIIAEATRSDRPSLKVKPFTLADVKTFLADKPGAIISKKKPGAKRGRDITRSDQVSRIISHLGAMATSRKDKALHKAVWAVEVNRKCEQCRRPTPRALMSETPGGKQIMHCHRPSCILNAMHKYL